MTERMVVVLQAKMEKSRNRSSLRKGNEFRSLTLKRRDLRTIQGEILT